MDDRVESFERPTVEVTARNWPTRPLAPAEIGTARDLLSAVGLAPQALIRRTSPAAFVDVAARGRTFTELFTLLRDRIAEDRVPWDVARTKIRFVGVTSRTKPAPAPFAGSSTSTGPAGCPRGRSSTCRSTRLCGPTSRATRSSSPAPTVRTG